MSQGVPPRFGGPEAQFIGTSKVLVPPSPDPLPLESRGGAPLAKFPKVLDVHPLINHHEIYDGYKP